MARPSAPRTKIAAAGTLAALAVLAGVATASKTVQQQAAPKAAAAMAGPMRTVEVRRTVGVLTKTDPAPAPPAEEAPAPAATTPATTPAATSAATARRGAAPAPSDDADGSDSAAGVGEIAVEVPESGNAEDECLAATAGGAPAATTASAATRAHTSRAARRRAARSARRAERRARRAARRRAAQARARGRMPLRTTHPLPQDVPGAVLDACGTVSPVTAATASGAPAVAAQVVQVP